MKDLVDRGLGVAFRLVLATILGVGAVRLATALWWPRPYRASQRRRQSLD